MAPYLPRVLFVCEDDAGASRMCAAFLEHLGGDRYESLAAALDPADSIPPEVGTALAEDGVTAHDGPGLAMTADLAGIVDRIVTLGFTLNPDVARDVPREEWGIPGLADRPLAEIRVLRDTGRRLVGKLVARLDTEAAIR